MNRIENDLHAIEQETLNLLQAIDHVKDWYCNNLTDSEVKWKVLELLTKSHPEDSEYLNQWIGNYIKCGNNIKYLYSTRTLLYALTIPSFTDATSPNYEINNKMQSCRIRLIQHYKQAVKECALLIPFGK